LPKIKRQFVKSLRKSSGIMAHRLFAVAVACTLLGPYAAERIDLELDREDAGHGAAANHTSASLSSGCRAPILDDHKDRARLIDLKMRGKSKQCTPCAQIGTEMRIFYGIENRLENDEAYQYDDQNMAQYYNKIAGNTVNGFRQLKKDLQEGKPEGSCLKYWLDRLAQHGCTCCVEEGATVHESGMRVAWAYDGVTRGRTGAFCPRKRNHPDLPFEWAKAKLPLWCALQFFPKQKNGQERSRLPMTLDYEPAPDAATHWLFAGADDESSFAGAYYGCLYKV